MSTAGDRPLTTIQFEGGAISHIWHDEDREEGVYIKDPKLTLQCPLIGTNYFQ